jgi:hypothetical protein
MGEILRRFAPQDDTWRAKVKLIRYQHFWLLAPNHSSADIPAATPSGVACHHRHCEVAMNVKFIVDVTTDAPPERVRAAFLDFSERRTDIWPMLSKKYFKVHSLGDATAEVTEGSDKPGGVWARERYDWSEPGIVRWTVLESNFSRPDHTMEVRIDPSGAGSRVRLFYDRATYGVKGNIAAVVMSIIGKKMMTGYYSDVLRRLASQQA